MRVRILQGCAGLDFSYRRGQEVELDDKVAASLVKDGLAQPLETEVKAPVKPVVKEQPKKGTSKKK